MSNCVFKLKGVVVRNESGGRWPTNEQYQWSNVTNKPPGDPSPKGLVGLYAFFVLNAGGVLQGIMQSLFCPVLSLKEFIEQSE